MPPNQIHKVPKIRRQSGFMNHIRLPQPIKYPDGKTAKDVKIIAKAKRQENKHSSATKPKGFGNKTPKEKKAEKRAKKAK